MRVQQAKREQYLAAMAFLADLAAHSSPHLRSFWQ